MIRYFLYGVYYELDDVFDVVFGGHVLEVLHYGLQVYLDEGFQHESVVLGCEVIFFEETCVYEQKWYLLCAFLLDLVAVVSNFTKSYVPLRLKDVVSPFDEFLPNQIGSPHLHLFLPGQESFDANLRNHK